jgi:SAM-dependent methyltransferase
MQQNQHITSSMPCNLCGSHAVSVLSTQSRSGGPLQTVICNQCGLVWSDPFPHDPRNYYENDYRVEYKHTYAPQPKHILRAGKVALERHRKIKHLLTAKLSILDVGTGGGEFAYLLSSLDHDVQGIEPNKGYGEYSAAEYGLKLHHSFIQDVDLQEQSFDLITIWHVLEHTEDPSFVLNKLQRLLKPDGTLVVEVPSIEATCQAPKSTFHEAHLYNFNEATLRAMGQKAGLTEQSHVFSDDGGNMTLFFRKVATDTTTASLDGMTDNAERIKKVVSSHTNINHFSSVAPYLRFMRRIVRALAEKSAVRHATSNKELLDQLYRSSKTD